jgi:hypothetical protein
MIHPIIQQFDKFPLINNQCKVFLLKINLCTILHTVQTMGVFLKRQFLTHEKATFVMKNKQNFGKKEKKYWYIFLK